MLDHPTCKVESAALDALLAPFAQETIVRVRRGAACWQGTNRPLRADAQGCLRPPAFRTASVTKTFTSALIFKLMEQGKLSVSDALAQYLGEQYLRLLPVNAGRSTTGRTMTLRHLLDHTSGLHDYATDPVFRAEVLRRPDRQWTAIELLDIANARAPYFAPGAGMAYSDTGYVLLGQVVEAVAGMPLNLAYQRLISAPLGLPNTYLEGFDAGSALPVSHAFEGQVDTFAFNPSFDTFGGGGLISTAEELDRFISALLSGSFFNQSVTLKSMVQGRATPDGVGTRKTFVACGISEFEIGGLRFWGHLGHWNSFMLRCHAQDLSLCGTFNQSQASAAQIKLLEQAIRSAMQWAGEA